MGAVGDVVAEIVADLDAAGVPATAEPGRVMPLLSQHGVVAFVDAPDVDVQTVSGRLVVSAQVRVCGNPPGGAAEMGRVWDALPDLKIRYGAQGTSTMGWFQHTADLALPFYPIQITRRTHC